MEEYQEITNRLHVSPPLLRPLVKSFCLDYFAVKPDSGQIVLTRPLPLHNQTFEFDVEVSDAQFKDKVRR